MQRCPLVDSSRRIHVKPFLIDKQFVQLGNCCYTLVLPLPHRSVQRSPIVRVFEVGLGTVEHKCLSYVLALLWVL